MSAEALDKRYTIEAMTTADSSDTITFLRKFFFQVIRNEIINI